jgi:hypothetical protein
MDLRALNGRGFLSTPEAEGCFWGLVGVALVVGIGMVIFLSVPSENALMALNTPLGTGR